jgi:predicted AlkP superfamily pyrophosphatase or phosphodiesterase
VAWWPTAAAQDPPRLLVILVIDQFRSDYLTTFAHRWRSGFRRLLDEGAFFHNAAYPYLNTVTCAGHSTIGTGAFPRTHGMVLNEWWHRDERRSRACMSDEASPVVSYGRPAEGGEGPKRLLVSTLGDALRATNRDARVVSLSLKARSAIGLAGHGGTAVTWFDDAAGAFVTSRAFAESPVPAVQTFIARDPFETDLGRTWTLQGPEHTYRFADDGPGERPPDGWDRRFPHEIAGQTGADQRFMELWRQSPFSDAYLARMGIALTDSFELGRRNATDFLGIGFSALDLVGHDFGPESREVEDLLARLDERIGELLRHLDERVGRDRYVLALSADHGVAPIPEEGKHQHHPGGRVLIPETRTRVEQALVEQFGTGQYVDAMNYTYIYLAPGVFDRLTRTPAAMRAVERALMTVPGIERVLRSDLLSPTSSDRVVRAAALSHTPGRSGDLIVVPRPYWFLVPRLDVAATTHGTSRPYDQRVPVILFGAGVKRGRFSQTASPADIAPTLAKLAGVRMPKAEGRVLREALR